MNLRKKSRSKLRIFGSFSTKLRLHRSETDLRVRDKSTPVLLGVKHHSEVTTLPSPRRDTESKLASRSFSVSCTSPRQTEVGWAPNSLSLHTLLIRRSVSYNWSVSLEMTKTPHYSWHPCLYSVFLSAHPSTRPRTRPRCRAQTCRTCLTQTPEPSPACPAPRPAGLCPETDWTSLLSSRPPWSSQSAAELHRSPVWRHRVGEWQSLWEDWRDCVSTTPTPSHQSVWPSISHYQTSTPGQTDRQNLRCLAWDCLG